MSYDGNESASLVGADYAKAELQVASSPAVLQAANKLYEAALLIRGAGALYATDIRDYLSPALKALNAQVTAAAERSRVPALEKPAPSVIQRGPDPAADLLRAQQRGENIQFR